MIQVESVEAYNRLHAQVPYLMKCGGPKHAKPRKQSPAILFGYGRKSTRQSGGLTAPLLPGHTASSIQSPRTTFIANHQGSCF